MVQLSLIFRKKLNYYLDLIKNQNSKQIKDIEEMKRLFEQIFDNYYMLTIEVFDKAKNTIGNIKTENQIQLVPPKQEKNTKTQSLSALCKNHKKEIIMIDIDSKDIQSEQRLFCIKCLSNGIKQQCQNIEEIDEVLNKKKEQQQQQDKIDNEQRSKKQIKQEKLNQQIASIKRKYYFQLNHVHQADFSSSKYTSEINKSKQTTIQQLNYDELISTINDLVQQNQEMVTLDEQSMSKDIENQLEKIKQGFQFDIQESINCLQDQSSDSQLQEIKEYLKNIQAQSVVQQEQQIRMQELDEFISSSKQLYCQMELVNQTTNKYQDHTKKIISIKNKLNVFSDPKNFSNIIYKFNEYADKFEKDFVNLKKYLEIEISSNLMQFLFKK